MNHEPRPARTSTARGLLVSIAKPALVVALVVITLFAAWRELTMPATLDNLFYSKDRRGESRRSIERSMPACLWKKQITREQVPRPYFNTFWPPDATIFIRYRFVLYEAILVFAEQEQYVMAIPVWD